MDDQEMRQRQNRMAIPMSAGGLLKVLADVADQGRRAAFRLQRSAHLIIRIRLRLRQLIERLVHEKNRTVLAAAQVEIVKDGGRPRIPTNKIEGIPGDPV